MVKLLQFKVLQKQIFTMKCYALRLNISEVNMITRTKLSIENRIAILSAKDSVRNAKIIAKLMRQLRKF